MTKPKSPTLDEVFSILANGEWADGLTVMRKAMRTIPPGVASRRALAIRDKVPHETEPPPVDALIESGRRTIVRESLTNALARGRLVADVPEITREHWRGELPWKLRDTEAGWLSIQEIAELLDIPESTARTWVAHGFVPTPTESASKAMRITPDQVSAWKLVREAWPGGSKRFAVDPRSLWDTPTAKCPHCGEPIAVTVTKAGSG